MTREEAIQGWIIPAIKNTWNEKKCKEILEALEQEPCEDAISREELRKAIDTWDRFGVDDTNSLFRLDNLSLPHYVAYIHYDDVAKCIKGMPPVTPQPKTGHWIVDSATSSQIGIHGKKTFSYEVHCDKCGWKWAYSTDKKDSIPSNYCPNCGYRMIEPQERSDE